MKNLSEDKILTEGQWSHFAMNECPRYTQIEFPPYRFIQGEKPHPTENPLGHSYGKKEPEIEFFVPDDWANAEQYLFGVDLYNYGYWWESHEAFESLWRLTSRGHVTRDYLQGLIKVSGAFLKWNSRNRKGLIYLFTGALDHLSKVEKVYRDYMGLNIRDYINKLEKHFKPVLEDQKWPDLQIDYPYIVLGFEEKMAKKALTKEKKQDLRCIMRAEYEGFGIISKGYGRT